MTSTVFLGSEDEGQRSCAKVPLVDLLRVYGVFEELNALFHQPLNYSNETFVEKFLSENGNEIQEVGHRLLPSWLNGRDAFGCSLMKTRVIPVQRDEVDLLLRTVTSAAALFSRPWDALATARFARDHYPDIRRIYYHVVRDWIPRCVWKELVGEDWNEDE